MKLYKLTNQNCRTRGKTLWGEGVTHTAPGGALCSDEVVHAYRSPLLAMLLNSVHANIENPVLWEANGDVCVDDGLKVGCTRLTTLQRLPLPVVTPAQQTRFAIYCALEVYDDPSFRAWAERWLDGSDRSQKPAGSAAWTAAAASAAWTAWTAVLRARDARPDLDFVALADRAMADEEVRRGAGVVGHLKSLRAQDFAALLAVCLFAAGAIGLAFHLTGGL